MKPPNNRSIKTRGTGPCSYDQWGVTPSDQTLITFPVVSVQISFFLSYVNMHFFKFILLLDIVVKQQKEGLNCITNELAAKIILLCKLWVYKFTMTCVIHYRVKIAHRILLVPLSFFPLFPCVSLHCSSSILFS